MLVLSRKLNQTIHIGDSISVSVVRIKGNVIQLGIDAPKAVHVVRAELLERDAKQAAQQKATPRQADDAGTPSTDGDTTDLDSEAEANLMAALRVISDSTAAGPNKRNAPRHTNLTIVV